MKDGHLRRFAGLREHYLFLVYVTWFVWLLLACIYFANSAKESLQFVRPLVLFGSTLIGVYVVLIFANRSKRAAPQQTPFPEEIVRHLLVVFFALFSAVAIMHLMTIGYLPVVRAFQLSNDYEIARIRQDGYHSLEIWQRYASDYAIKGVGPALLVLAAHYRSRLLYPAIAIGIFYTSALYVKANSVYLLLPLIFYYILTRQKLRATVVMLLMVVAVGLSWSSSSPDIRGDITNMKKFVTERRDRPTINQVGSIGEFPGHTIVASLRERLVVVPAQVTAQWYYEYENPVRREGGCGYRVVARLIGCEYVHIPTKLYAIYYADLVSQRSLMGSLNSASYIHDFANFGYLGVLFGAIVFAFMFYGLHLLCGSTPTFLALSLMPVLSLSEMPLSTVLNSGGWLFIIALSLFLQYGARVSRHWKADIV